MIAAIDKAVEEEIRRTRARIYVMLTTTSGQGRRSNGSK